MSAPENQVIGLFPVPFMRIEKLLDTALVTALIARFSDEGAVANSGSSLLAHSRLLTPGGDPLLQATHALIAPRLADFGALLFGEVMPWAIKEMWVNILQTGGQQAVHNHANCFVSGVVYLTPSDPSANTVFMKGLGGHDFAFRNAHQDAALGPFNADRWVSPDPAPGDLVLFPSYLLHAVPPNQGPQRLTLAFNAIPERLDSWGYAVGFSTMPNKDLPS